MTDRPSNHDQTDPIGDRIRGTLHSQLRAEEARVANGVVGPDRRAPSTDRAPGRPPGRLVLALAAVVMVAAVGVGLLANRPDRGQRVQTADDAPTTTLDDDPTTTADDGPTTTVTGDPTTTDPTGEAPADPDPSDIGPTAALPDPDPDAGFSRAGGYIVAQLLDDGGETWFVAVETRTGQVTNTFFSTFLEASWYSPIELAPGGDALYLTQGFEDSWFSCESTLPELLRLDLDPSGRTEPVWIGQGAEPRVSPDGTRLAYLTASDCVPDPQNPGNWVVAPLDTVVVRDLGTDEEMRHTVPGLVEALTSGIDGDVGEGELRGLVWLGDDRLGVSGGDILDATDLTPTGDRIPVLIETGSSGRVLGYHPRDGSFLVEVTVWADDGTAEATIQSVDLATGTRVDQAIPVRSHEDRPAAYGLDATGRYLYAVGDDDLVRPAADVTPGATGEVVIVSVDW